MPSWPTRPVSALTATLQTPKRMPAAAASMTPWCSAGTPTRGPRMSRPPMPSRRPRSRPSDRARRTRATHGLGSVRPSSTRPRAVTPAPPLALADLEAEDAIRHDGDQHDAAGEDGLDDRQRGQRDAATCRTQPPLPTPMPIANQGDVQSPGRYSAGADVDRRSLAGTRCLKRNPRFVAKAQAKRQQDAQMERHAGFIQPIRSTWRCRPMTPSSAPPDPLLDRPVAR